MKFSILIAVLIYLNACAIERVSQIPSSDQPAEDAVPEEQLSYTAPSKRPYKAATKQALNPALKSLIAQAQQDIELGKLEAAAKQLERAVRISPRSAEVHYELASLRLLQDQAHSALQLALKGKTLIGAGDEDLHKNYWRLIGDCYTALGKTAQAEQAYRKI